MPKTRRDRSLSFERPRKSLVPCSSSSTCQPPSKEDLNEWEEARCPVCMEHPHNAVLLVCSAYDKGCRPYMCDTSYRHSNCLDQFRKSFVEEDKLDIPSQETMVVTPQEDKISHGQGQGQVTTEIIARMHKLKQKLVCPLCRGQISGWVVVDSARDFMNSKNRSCASESCGFNGNYTNLRKHARSQHPLVRPSEADPERERSWRRLERQRDIGDVLSTIQSTLGDDNDNDNDNNNDHDDLVMDEHGWITIFFLFRVWQPSSSSRTRSRGQSGVRRRSDRHWGESYDANRVDRAHRNSATIEVEDSSDDGGSRRPRTRRRLSTPDDEI